MNQRDMNLPLADVQSAADHRHLAIDRVGIRGLRYPIAIKTIKGDVVQTVATFSLSVRLEHDVKGTHMSRFIELLEARREPWDANTIDAILQSMMTRLHVAEGEIALTFPYFVEKTAPVSRVKSLMDYEVTITGTRRDNESQISTRVVIPVTSLCPCSKEISAYGAHNQRSHITISVQCRNALPIEDLIGLAEAQASSELFGILKRTDEKFVTERAYDNPKFVEDLVRDVAAALDRDERIASYVVETENFESIHNHSAWARIERNKFAS